MIVGIISYFPDDSVVREVRRDAHRKQLEWLREYFPDIPVYVAQRNYHKEDFVEGIHYFEAPPGPGSARNVLLRYFYNTDEDFMLLLDDDCSIREEYYGGLDLIREINDNPKKFIGRVDILNCLNPQFVGFKYTMLSIKETVEKYYTFLTPTMKQMGFSIISNFKKLHGDEIYFYEGHFDNERNHINIREDVIFFLEAAKRGYYIASCQDLIFRSFCPPSITTCFELDSFDPETNCKAHREAELPTKIYIEEHYGIDRNDKYGMSKFLKKFSPIKRYSQFKIERATPHVFTERELDYKPRKKS